MALCRLLLLSDHRETARNADTVNQGLISCGIPRGIRYPQRSRNKLTVQHARRELAGMRDGQPPYARTELQVSRMIHTVTRDLRRLLLRCISRTMN